jgi:NADH-quinone oxidoreductase subunit C
LSAEFALGTALNNPTGQSDEGNGSTLMRLLRIKLGDMLLESQVSLGDEVVRIDRAALRPVLTILRDDVDFNFSMFLSVTVVDWMDRAEERFEIVYHLLSVEKHYRLRVKAWVPENSAEVDSVSDLWAGANFMEREAWDMYGVRFKGHPDLRRILMYDEFKGHPLRKDYPVQAKQPRIPMRTPEVRNTAVDMHRPPLVQIRPRQGGKNGAPSGAERQ